VHLAFESAEDHREVNVEAIDDVIPVWCVPVRFDGGGGGDGAPPGTTSRSGVTLQQAYLSSSSACA